MYSFENSFCLAFQTHQTLVDCGCQRTSNLGGTCYTAISGAVLAPAINMVFSALSILLTALIRKFCLSYRSVELTVVKQISITRDVSAFCVLTFRIRHFIFKFIHGLGIFQFKYSFLQLFCYTVNFIHYLREKVQKSGVLYTTLLQVECITVVCTGKEMKFCCDIIFS
jgi:hypothetical protein